MFIAHKTETAEQPLLSHLEGTAKLAKQFASAFGSEEYAYRAGLLHDLGKYSEAFQQRIRGGPKCDHSTAGAREADKLGVCGRLLAYCIAGHHSGLPNRGSASDTGQEGSLHARLVKDIEPYDMAFTELDKQAFTPLPRPNIKPIGKGGFSLSMYIRMLYSCLVDADFLDTEQFMSGGIIDRTVCYDFPAFLELLNRRLEKFPKEGVINQKRAEILSSCREAANTEKGLFTLTVPTGGGKTLSSLAFAIEHLQKHLMDRIIYVIPYTSIIEQNARIFEKLLGEENVLQHHSNFDFEDNEHKVGNKLKLSSENWDIPIVVTTNVQFFESLFANKSSRCRKLHNMANSVIILDEAQMLPVEYLLPCVRALCELVQNYNASVVLCSATQPALDCVLPKGVVPREICKNINDLYTSFQRTRTVKRGRLDTQSLAIELTDNRQALCILNTRKHALDVFSLLDKKDSFHLSTLMCPIHRLKVIEEIRVRLRNNLPCRVVSTRLIEAGVDVDFPVVYRSVCGLDSIIQSAGRCNREGLLTDIHGNPVMGTVHIFEPDDEYAKRQPAAFLRPISVTREIMRKYEDILSPEAVKAYFSRLYQLAGNSIDNKGVFSALEDGFDARRGDMAFDFSSVAKKFKLIEKDTHAIIIPYDQKAKQAILKLKQADRFGDILRTLQRYTVSIYKPEFDGLRGIGALEEIPGKEVYVLKEDSEMYDSHTGLKIIRESGNGIYI